MFKGTRYLFVCLFLSHSLTTQTFAESYFSETNASIVETGFNADDLNHWALTMTVPQVQAVITDTEVTATPVYNRLDFGRIRPEGHRARLRNRIRPTLLPESLQSIQNRANSGPLVSLGSRRSLVRHQGEMDAYDLAAAAHLGDLYSAETITARENAIAMIYFLSLRQTEPRASVNIGQRFNTNELGFLPLNAIYAYNLMTETNAWDSAATRLSAHLGETLTAQDIRTSIENWANIGLADTFNLLNLVGFGNLGIDRLTGILAVARVVNRWTAVEAFLALMDRTLHNDYYADGFRWENSFAYHDQVWGRTNGIRTWVNNANIIPSTETGAEALRLRIKTKFDYLQRNFPSGSSNSEFPDGSKIAYGDTRHARSLLTAPLNATIQNPNNIELFAGNVFSLKHGASNANYMNPVLTFGRHEGAHSQPDEFGLVLWHSQVDDIFADWGYVTPSLESTNSRWDRLKQYIHGGYSHNTIGIAGSGGYGGSTPSLIAYDDGSSNGKKVQLMQISQGVIPAQPTSQNFLRRRAILLISVDDDNSYVLDLGEMRGGAEHFNRYAISYRDTFTLTSDDTVAGVPNTVLRTLLNQNNFSGGIAPVQDVGPSGGLNGLIGGQVRASWLEESSDTGLAFSLLGNSTQTTMNVFMNAQNNVTDSPQIVGLGDFNVPGSDFLYMARVSKAVDNETTYHGAVYEVFHGRDAFIDSVSWDEYGDAASPSLTVTVNGNGFKDVITYDPTQSRVKQLPASVTTANARFSVVRYDLNNNIKGAYVYDGGSINALGDYPLSQPISPRSTETALLSRIDSNAGAVELNKSIDTEQIGNWMIFNYSNGDSHGIPIAQTQDSPSTSFTEISTEHRLPLRSTGANSYDVLYGRVTRAVTDNIEVSFPLSRNYDPISALPEALKALSGDVEFSNSIKRFAGDLTINDGENDPALLQARSAILQAFNAWSGILSSARSNTNLDSATRSVLTNLFVEVSQKRIQISSSLTSLTIELNALRALISGSSQTGEDVIDFLNTLESFTTDYDEFLASFYSSLDMVLPNLTSDEVSNFENAPDFRDSLPSFEHHDWHVAYNLKDRLEASQGWTVSAPTAN